MAKIEVDYSLPDNSLDGSVEIYRSTSQGSLGTLVTTRSPSDPTTYTDSGLANSTKYYYTVRRQTDHAQADSTQEAQYTKPAAPGQPTVTVNELLATHDLSWPDNATGEDGYDVLESRDGGTQTAAATGLAADTTSFTTDRQDRTDSYEYQVRAFVGTGSERAESLSGTETAFFPTYSNYWAVVEETDGTTTVLTDTIESGPAYEHTALHGFTHALTESDVPFGDWGPLTEIEVFLDDERLFFGELTDLDEDTPSEGSTTVEAHGPAQALTRTAPPSKVTYTDVLVYQALEDYLANEVTSIDVSGWDVFAPPGETQADDTLALSDSLTGFAGLASPAADDAYSSSGSLLVKQAGFVAVEDDMSGGTTTTADNPGNPPYHIDGEYLEAGNGTTPDATFTPDHDIPSERVIIAIHRDLVDGAGTLSTLDVTFNGEALDAGTLLNATDRWSIWEAGEYTGSDLSASSNYTLEVSTGDYAFNFDAFALLDDAYGPYTYDDPTSLGEKIDGPRLYKPVPIDLTDESRTYTVQEARVESTVNDITNGFQWEFTTTAGSSSLTATTEDATFDFFANAQYGTDLEPSITLDGYGSNTWLADGANPQEITSIDIYVTTVDIASLGSIELTDSHYRNIQRLHEQAGMRWVVDPTIDRRVDGIVAESFAPDATAAEKAVTWTELDVSRRRQMEGYANAVTVNYIGSNGNDQQFVGAADSAEVSRVGEEVRKVIFAPNVETNDQARNVMLNERRERIARDRLSGTIRAVADPVLPGYRYSVSEFGGYTSLERTQYVESVDSVEMSLQFELDDDVLRRVLDAEATVDTIQERL